MSAALKRPIERLAYRRDEAAAALGVSLTKFEELVRDGLMPKPVRVRGCVLYDAHQLAVHWQAILAGESASVDSTNPYDKRRA